MFTLHIQKWMEMRRHVCSQTHRLGHWRKNGEGTVAIKSDESKEVKCVLSYGQRDTFSVRSILRKIGWPTTKKQFTVRYCRKAERHFCARERKLQSQANAPTYEDLYQEWTQHCEEQTRIAAWELHKHIFKYPRDVPRKQGYVLQNKDCCRSCRPNRNQPWRKRVYSRLRRICAYALKKKEAIRKSKGSCTTITAKGTIRTITTTEEATVYVKNLDSWKHVYWWGYLESLSAHVPEAMPMQHRETDRRQPLETESNICQTGFNHSRKDWQTEKLDHRAVLVKRCPKHLLHMFQRDSRTNLEGNTIYSPILWRTPVVILQAQKNHESPMQKKSWKSRRQDTTSHIFWGCLYSASQSSQRRERIAITPSICGRSTRFV